MATTKLFDTVSYADAGTALNVAAAEYLQVDLAVIAADVVVTAPGAATEGQVFSVEIGGQDGVSVVTMAGPLTALPLPLQYQSESAIYTWDPDYPGAAQWVIVSVTYDWSKRRAVYTSANGTPWEWADAAARITAGAAATTDDVGFIGYQQDMQREYQLLGVSRWAPLRDPKIGPITLAIYAGCGVATYQSLGCVSTTGGTATSRTAGSGTPSLQMPRISQVSAAGVNQLIQSRPNSQLSGLFPADGFRYGPACSFPAVTCATPSHFQGLLGTFIAANFDPANLTNCVGLAYNTGDANMRIVHNDGAGTATEIDLGTSFPAGTVNVGYSLELWTADGTEYSYQVVNLDTGAEISGTITTNLPASTLLLSWQHAMSNNATAVAITMDVGTTVFAPRIA